MLYNSNKEINLKDETQENVLAIYLEDEQINYIPDRESGYTLDLSKSSCNNGVEISFDYNTWSVKTNYSNYINTDNTRVKCSLYFTSTYIEPILNGTDPILEDPLIPVTISDDGVVRKADLASEWYDYETRQWANAVILEDESKSYASNEVIPEENIESYFVWIPKYRYQLWDLGNYDSLTTIDTNKVHEIPVIFGDYNTSDSVSGECTTPMESGASGNCEVGDYMTHPAFLSIPSTGFWVGKFKISKNNGAFNIKPNQKILIGLSLGQAFQYSYSYQRELDSHMLKNTEWGAITYLSHSKYGIQNVLSLNTDSESRCGYASEKIEGSSWSENAFPYNTKEGFLASTTGNITGIYDLSGLTSEYVMAINYIRNYPDNSEYWELYKIENEIPDFYSNLEYRKYYDEYFGTSSSSYNKRILGDATGEMGPFGLKEYSDNPRYTSSWYESYSYFVYENDPFFVRGGSMLLVGRAENYTILTSSMGGAAAHQSFRVVLTPTSN